MPLALITTAFICALFSLCRVPHCVAVAQVRLTTRLGVGAYGDVHAGRWRRNEVAVKQMVHGELTEVCMCVYTRARAARARVYVCISVCVHLYLCVWSRVRVCVCVSGRCVRACTLLLLFLACVPPPSHVRASPSCT